MTTLTKPRFPFFSLVEPRIRILHYGWLAFFVSFVMWFNHAPLMAAIRDTFNLTKPQVAALLTLNVALAIPGRLIVGIIVDKIGPRLMYSGLLLATGIIAFFFAFAQSYTALAVARFLLGLSGAGFVVGIRLIGEWFPARETGLAQGIYGGLGNFGSAAAAFALPWVASLYGGADGWRWAVAATGVIAIAYAAIFYAGVRDMPKGSTYFTPKKLGAMEVTSKSDFFLYCVMQAPLTMTLALLAYRLGPSGMKIMPDTATLLCYIGLGALFAFQIYDTWRINKSIFSKAVAPIHQYKFRQVAVLDYVYFITFGSELAVVSILPLLFKDTFGLSLGVAGFLGASFGLSTFFARPAGGYLSDIFGRKRVLVACLIGTTLGYFGMSNMGQSTGVAFAVLVTFFCSLFVNAGNGAVYAMLPMIKRRLTGQIAGMVGAFGNVGGVIFLTVYGAFDAQTMLAVAAGCSALGLALVFLFVEDPKGQIAEEMPDGTIAMIDVT
ncbi:MAG: MFS transporter [Pseudomonadota bacterium]|nr:MFS transporter [Pseudomonadota bacterium]